MRSKFPRQFGSRKPDYETKQNKTLQHNNNNNSSNNNNNNNNDIHNANEY